MIELEKDEDRASLIFIIIILVATITFVLFLWIFFRFFYDNLTFLIFCAFVPIMELWIGITFLDWREKRRIKQ